jgi:uncharacterized membrane protein
VRGVFGDFKARVVRLERRGKHSVRRLRLAIAPDVLISQNRSSKIDELREEIDLQINVRAEQEITRMIIMLDQIYEKLGLGEEDDAELILMKQKTDLGSIEKSILKEIERTKKP